MNIKRYEDFQDSVNDEQLILGAYRIGVIGWEAQKVLLQAKDNRHLFSGHPRSSTPTPLKVLSLMEDCVKYVLSQEYPNQIVDIDDYIGLMGTSEFDRNTFVVENTLSDLPEKYKTELIHRIFSSYIRIDCSTILRSNIEFVAPLFWKLLPKDTKIQVVRRIDGEITRANITVIKSCFAFVELVEAMKYLSMPARRYAIEPVIERLVQNLDNWAVENACTQELLKFAGYIPSDLLPKYVNAITQTYVGYIGSSYQSSRKDFYANGSAPRILEMFERFDDASADAFIDALRTNQELQSRINHPIKLRRIRSLAIILIERVSDKYPNKRFLKLLADEGKEKEFFSMILKKSG